MSPNKVQTSSPFSPSGPRFPRFPWKKIPLSWVRDPVACYRLRDSRVRGESANMKIKRSLFRVPFTFAASPLSVSLEQARDPGAHYRLKVNLSQLLYTDMM